MNRFSSIDRLRRPELGQRRFFIQPMPGIQPTPGGPRPWSQRNAWINFESGTVQAYGETTPEGTSWVLLHNATPEQRRAWLSARQAQRKAGLLGGLGIWPFSESGSALLDRAKAITDQLRALNSTIKEAVAANPGNTVLKQQAGTYETMITSTIGYLEPGALSVQYKVGGAQKDGAIKAVDSAETNYKRVKEMFEADLKDPSGQAGTAIAQERYGADKAESIRRGKVADFVESITNPALGFMESIQKYAKWLLIGGAVLLVAPVVAPLIGKSIGGYRAGKGSTVKANRRRRR